MKFKGKVDKKLYAAGSKSERNAVVLVTKTKEYVLRRQGGNAFQDDVLDNLVGQNIECEGTVHNNVLIMENFHGQ